MEQILCHIFGDFFLQSDWMAMNKSKKSFNCLIHVLVYTSVFLFLTTSWKALLVIGGTHFILDRWHTPLKRLLWLKNHFPTMDYPPYEFCESTGYYDDSPYNRRCNNDKVMNIFVERRYGKPRHFFITIWIYIIIDNCLHLTFNYLALKYLV